MVAKKIVSTIIAFAMLALAGCSSTSGGGSNPPSDVTVVVPPSS